MTVRVDPEQNATTALFGLVDLARKSRACESL